MIGLGRLLRCGLLGHNLGSGHAVGVYAGEAAARLRWKMYLLLPPSARL